MKKLLATVVCAVVMSGCAGLTVMEEQSRPLSRRIYSQTPQIQTAALEEFGGLNAGQKNDTLLETAQFMRVEQNAQAQSALLTSLKANNAGGSVIYPLISAVSNNHSVKDASELVSFINATEPAPAQDMPKIRQLLAQRPSVSATLALTALGRMSKNASGAAPEIVAFMHENAADRDAYFAAVDALFKIDPMFTVAILSIDVKDTAKEVRQAAVEKMANISTYMDKNLPVTKQVTQTMMSVIFSADDVLAEVARKAVESSGDKDLLRDYEKTLAAGKSAFSGLIKLVGSGLQGMFKAHEKNSFENAIKFYEDAGRLDAAAKMKNEMRNRGLDK